MSIAAYIYLLQDGNDLGTNIYKIGKTVQSGGDTRKLKRLCSYSHGTVVKYVEAVPSDLVDFIEQQIILLFNQEFMCVRGKEWFVGDYISMKKYIRTVVSNFEDKLDGAESIDHVSYSLLPMKRVFTATKYPVIPSLDQPIVNKTPSALVCDLCERIYANTDSLRVHKKKCQGKVNPLECTYCHREFLNVKSKYNHKAFCKMRKHVGNSKSQESVPSDTFSFPFDFVIDPTCGVY